MVLWQMLVIAGILFLIVEMFLPLLFFLNFAIACFITSLIALFVEDLNYLIPIFVVFSALFLIFLRPLLIKKKGEKSETGVEEKYIGKVAKVSSVVTSDGGVITIYNERWDARSNLGDEIPVGANVKIVRNESLILFVEKIY